MIRILGIAVCMGFSSAVEAQPAQLEIKGIFGECIPVWAAATDQLLLYREPDLRAETITIPFLDGWRIEAPKSEGLTRVL
jgi:hypothetical protein